MQIEGRGPLKLSLQFYRRARRPDLHVLPSLLLSDALYDPAERAQVVRTLDERLAMIRERQRDQPAPGEPASNGAKNQRAPQFLGRARRRERNRLILIGTLQGT